MNPSILRSKVLKEVDLVPEDLLKELYDFIHFFRLGVESSKKPAKKIMQFAGCWQDMPDEVFEEFLADSAERRKQAFSRRRSGETGSD